MFAILETGGKQYKVEEGDVIEVEIIDPKCISNQNMVKFSDVLLIKNSELHLGQPYVKNGKIEAQILEEFKAPKITVFKKKSKKRYKKTRGHRQHLHRIKIERIEISKSTEKKDDVEKEARTIPVKKIKPAPKAKIQPKPEGKETGVTKKTVTPVKKGKSKTEPEKKTKAATEKKGASVKKKESK